jgi:lipopolysaccharide transport system ATP-binding protein
MSNTVIRVENIGKKYNLDHLSGQERSDMFIKTAKDAIKKILKAKKEKEEFWALKDISFEIKQGDRVGIIGRNGAGKSTLLKILSRIVTPTTGRIEYEGRIASLLEVGTGFHGDLTGRENIYLNGSILGMGRAEINKKFDEIVDFSEVEKFLDTPVKRYSSGMYVRLAFAVAAHLDPEILVVDEVLAVGDSVFQKKCIDKMTDIAKTGKTILFVSHSFSNINALCDKAILLENGRLTLTGSVHDVFNSYFKTIRITNAYFDLEHLERFGEARELIFKDINFEQLPVPFGKRIKFFIRLKTNNASKKYTELDFGVNFCDKQYNPIYHCSNRFINVNLEHKSDDDKYYFEVENDLKPGIYNLVMFLRSNDVSQDFLINRVSVEIAEGNPYGYNDTQQIQGATLPEFKIYKA